MRNIKRKKKQTEKVKKFVLMQILLVEYLRLILTCQRLLLVINN